MRLLLLTILALLIGYQPVSAQVAKTTTKVAAKKKTPVENPNEEIEFLEWDTVARVTKTPAVAKKPETAMLEEEESRNFDPAYYYPVADFYDNWSTENMKPYGFNPSTFTGADTLVLNGLGDAKFVIPIDDDVTSHYGWRRGRIHAGTDIDLETGDPVRTCFDGVVRLAQSKSGYGNLVIVRHLNGLETYYAHLSRIDVKPGETVFAGDVLGLGGRTGRATGSHLHFETRYKDQAFDSRKIIDWYKKELKDTILIIDAAFFGVDPVKEEEHEHDHKEIDHNLKKNEILAKKGTRMIHIIQPKDTLYALALKYGTTVDKICRLNNMKSTDVLNIGQKIRIQ